MPVSNKRRRNGKLKKQPQRFIPVNVGEDKQKEIQAMYTSKERLGKIEKLEDSTVQQKGNAKVTEGECINRTMSRWEKIEEKWTLIRGKSTKEITVISSIALTKAKTAVKGLKKYFWFIDGIKTYPKQRYDSMLLLKQGQQELKRLTQDWRIKGAEDKYISTAIA